MNKVTNKRKESKHYKSGDIFAISFEDHLTDFYILADIGGYYNAVHLGNGTTWMTTSKPNAKDAVEGLVYVGSDMKIEISK